MNSARKVSIAAAAVLALALGGMPAARAASLVGTWQGNFAMNGTRCNVQSIYMADGNYTELMRCGTLMTRQGGTYVLRGSLLVRVVESWEPRQQYVYGTGMQAMEKPPGGSWRIAFPDANTLQMRDVNFGGQLVLRRASPF